jgi:hypothetical protein
MEQGDQLLHFKVDVKQGYGKIFGEKDGKNLCSSLKKSVDSN